MGRRNHGAFFSRIPGRRRKSPIPSPPPELLVTPARSRGARHSLSGINYRPIVNSIRIHERGTCTDEISTACIISLPSTLRASRSTIDGAERERKRERTERCLARMVIKDFGEGREEITGWARHDTR